MPTTRRNQVDPQISAVRRAAALARWQGQRPPPAAYRTIRVRADVLERLAATPGDTWSSRIAALLPPLS